MSDTEKSWRPATTVKVKVTKTSEGTIVEADCQCFGYPFRVHSNLVCPLLRKESS